MSGSDSFLCDGCGRKFALTPAVAGKKVRCKCGAIIDIPAAVSATPSHDVPPLDDDLYGFADEPAASAVEPIRPIQPIQPVAAPVAVSAAGKSGTKSAPAQSIAGFSASAPKVIKYDNSTDNRRGVILAVIGLLAIGVLIGAFSLISKSKPATAAASGPDAEILKLMKEEGTEEAKAFVEAHQSRMIMGMTRESSLAYVDRLYDRGAVQVLAFANGIVTRSLVIELPADPEKRDALITYTNQWHEDMGIAPVTDEGQRYLRLMMRI